MPALTYNLAICEECAALLGVAAEWRNLGPVRTLAYRCALCELQDRPLRLMSSRMPAADLQMAIPAIRRKQDKALAESEAVLRERAALELKLQALEQAIKLAEKQTPAQLKAQIASVKNQIKPKRNRVIDLS